MIGLIKVLVKVYLLLITYYRWTFRFTTLNTGWIDDWFGFCFIPPARDGPPPSTTMRSWWWTMCTKSAFQRWVMLSRSSFWINIAFHSDAHSAKQIRKPTENSANLSGNDNHLILSSQNWNNRWIKMGFKSWLNMLTKQRFEAQDHRR